LAFRAGRVVLDAVGEATAGLDHAQQLCFDEESVSFVGFSGEWRESLTIPGDFENLWKLQESNKKFFGLAGIFENS
jgi:hypothetical protein